MDNQGILATAHNEYMDQMNDILIPFMITTFDEIYERAKVDTKGKNVLIRFQQYLKDIKSWNQGVLREATVEVSNSCAYFRELLTAIFVGYTKILSSIRLRTDKVKVAIKLPKSEDFMYKIYEENAKALYKNPYWVGEDLSEDDKIDKMRPMNRKTLEIVVKSLVPVQTILDTYIGNNGTATEVESNIDPDEDTEDPEALDPEENTEEAAIPPVPEPLEPMDEPEIPEPDEMDEPMDDPDDIKDIQVNRPPPGMIEDGDAEDDGDLFNDREDLKLRSRNKIQ
jgi:hypothetical protein